MTIFKEYDCNNIITYETDNISFFFYELRFNINLIEKHTAINQLYKREYYNLHYNINNEKKYKMSFIITYKKDKLYKIELLEQKRGMKMNFGLEYTQLHTFLENIEFNLNFIYDKIKSSKLNIIDYKETKPNFCNLYFTEELHNKKNNKILNNIIKDMKEINDNKKEE